MVGLGSGAENHTLSLDLGISTHFKSTISHWVSPLVTFPKQELENHFISKISISLNHILIKTRY